MTLTDIRYTLMGFMGNSGLLWFHGLIELISNLFNKQKKRSVTFHNVAYYRSELRQQQPNGDKDDSTRTNQPFRRN